MLITEKHGAVAVLRIEHGRVGALDVELLNALTDAITGSDRALIITGTGSTYSAGVDLRRILHGSPVYTEALLTSLSRMYQALFDHPRPTLAAINGHAIAGGCVLALACDQRLMSGGLIGLSELAVGVPFPTSALEIVRHAIGSRAGVMLLGARNVDPQRAYQLGLVDELTTPESLLPRAMELAAELADRSPTAYRLAKEQLHRPTREAIAAITDGDAAVAAGWTAEDTRQRIAAALAALNRRRANPDATPSQR
ncbi:enoyl-CoA hydratase/isomerase family protein [Rhodococcus sp. LB1]|uniref:enoyl-CoA hydratase/isomerase family protein n=1 Tax=Rhodococcus sp. LB1 TaxID=1807499 RepID=UPI00077B1981|nr:enoyl-CoA hydratase/isomerase family protein [Rhodococcus sp. LB1]KXX55879.1 enoyl-CoA hydratase [Rhodococcus sp. LB1]